VVTLERTPAPPPQNHQRVAAPGERVTAAAAIPGTGPQAQRQNMAPFLQHLGQLGYQVDHKLSKRATSAPPPPANAVPGVARCDGVLGQPSTGQGPPTLEKPARPIRKWPAAAEHIDFTRPARPSSSDPAHCRRHMRRIAKAFFTSSVLNTNQPFIVPITVAWRTPWLNVANSKQRQRAQRLVALETSPRRSPRARMPLQHRPWSNSWPTRSQRLDEPLPVHHQRRHCARPAAQSCHAA